MLILFLHGLHSVPGGVKPTYLAEHGHTVINPKLPDDDFSAALAIAQAEYEQHQPKVIVGSSRGGALAMNLNAGDTPLVLLCPAWKSYGTARTIKESTIILHSRADDVVPFSDSEELVRDSGLHAFTLVEVGTDHRLADQESLEMLLEACGGDDDDDAQPEVELDILERDWSGLCYTAALRWACEAEEKDWLVVHGTVRTAEPGKRIEHAWCERGDQVVDLSVHVGPRVVEREWYYRILQPEVVKMYSTADAVLLSFKNKHDGPWDEHEQLRE